MKLIDIGANLLDPVYSGIYRGHQKHASDLHKVLERAWQTHVDKIIITAGTLRESQNALQMTSLSNNLFSTVGVHPTRCLELEKGGTKYFEKLVETAQKGKSLGKIVAIGECGLDYDRLQFCPRDIQLKHFEKHLDLAEITALPLFLHNRNCAFDLIDILKRNRSRFSNAVVHSFTGTKEELDAFLELGLYIGVNGCSLKSEENLAVVKQIPIDRLMIETDCPWCDIRNTHVGKKYVTRNWDFSSKPGKHVIDSEKLVKGRNEPCTLIQVLQVLSGVFQMEIEVIAEATYQNTQKVFFPNEMKF